MSTPPHYVTRRRTDRVCRFQSPLPAFRLIYNLLIHMKEQTMKNLTIAKRLVLLIAASIVALAIVGIVGINAAIRGERGVQEIRDDSLASIKTIAAARSAFQQGRVNVYADVLSMDDAAMDSVEQQLKGYETETQSNLKKYESLVSNDEDRKHLEAERLAVQQYFAMFWEKVQPLARKHETEAALKLLRGDLHVLAAKAQEAFDKHVAFNENQAVGYSDEVVSSVQSAVELSIGTIIVAVLAIGAMGFMMLSSIRSSLNHIRDKVGHVETNLDFTARVDVLRQDEIGVTAQAFNRLLEKLQGNLQTILARAGTVAQSANQMATTSGQVAIASHNQSEAASNMAATIEEMTVSINHVGDRAYEADRISAESGRLANSGEAIIGRTVGDIDNISTTVQPGGGTHPGTGRAEPEDLECRRRHQGSRGSNQPVGAQRGHRSGTGGRTGARVCRRCR
ncbi:MAG: methyl-accepting chemotaxis protein [Propionivibrio sp.]